MRFILSAAIPSLTSETLSVLACATIGGGLVFLGLCMEKLAEFMNARFMAPPEEPHKALESWGWVVLMVGILAEIFAGGAAAMDEWQVRQIAIQNDPSHQRLKSIEAVATVIFSSGSFISNRWVESPRPPNVVPIMELKIMSKSGFRLDLWSDSFPPPQTENPGPKGRPSSNSVSIHIGGNIALQAPYISEWNNLVGQTNLTAGQMADSDFTASLWSGIYFPPGTAIMGGSLKIWFNSPEVDRNFSLPPQLLRSLWDRIQLY